MKGQMTFLLKHQSTFVTTVGLLPCVNVAVTDQIRLKCKRFPAYFTVMAFFATRGEILVFSNDHRLILVLCTASATWSFSRRVLHTTATR